MTSITRQRERDVTRLAKAIVSTVRKHRRGFTTEDAQAAGFSQTDITRLWDDAIVEARRMEPGIAEMAVQQ